MPTPDPKRQWRLELRPETVYHRSRAPETRRLPPSRNSGGKGLHWAVLSRWTNAFKTQVYWLCKEAKVPKLHNAHIELANVTIQPMDRDNLYACAKPLIDGIVQAGVIDDDDDEHCDVVCRNVRVRTKAERRVVIIITAYKP